MSQQQAMWARKIGGVCGEACGRAVAEQVRAMLEDGLGVEQVAQEAARVTERAVLAQLRAVMAAVNEDEEREEVA